MTKLIIASRKFASAPKNRSQGNVGDIFSPRSIFEEKLGDYRLAHSDSEAKLKI